MSAETFTVDSAITSLTVTVADCAVTRIEFGRRTRHAPRGPLQNQIARELAEYLDGKRTAFSFPVQPEGTAFDRRVWAELRRIPYGETRTYGEVARVIGKPGAARAVGTANGRNPVPLVVPCHRVVAAGGRLGGFGGGLPLKKSLLALENAHGPALHEVGAVNG